MGRLVLPYVLIPQNITECLVLMHSCQYAALHNHIFNEEKQKPMNVPQIMSKWLCSTVAIDLEIVFSNSTTHKCTPVVHLPLPLAQLYTSCSISSCP